MLLGQVYLQNLAHYARGNQQQIALWNEKHKTATLIPIISADGTVYPPTVIFCGKQIQGKGELPNPLNAS